MTQPGADGVSARPPVPPWGYLPGTQGTGEARLPAGTTVYDCPPKADACDMTPPRQRKQRNCLRERRNTTALGGRMHPARCCTRKRSTQRNRMRERRYTTARTRRGPGRDRTREPKAGHNCPRERRYTTAAEGGSMRRDSLRERNAQRNCRAGAGVRRDRPQEQEGTARPPARTAGTARRHAESRRDCARERSAWRRVPKCGGSPRSCGVHAMPACRPPPPGPALLPVDRGVPPGTTPRITAATGKRLPGCGAVVRTVGPRGVPFAPCAQGVYSILPTM